MSETKWSGYISGSEFPEDQLTTLKPGDVIVFDMTEYTVDRRDDGLGGYTVTSSAETDPSSKSETGFLTDESIKDAIDKEHVVLFKTQS